MTRMTKLEFVVQLDQSDDGKWPPSNAQEFLLWFQDKLRLIPEEYRAAAQVYLGMTTPGVGDSYASFDLYYERPETDEEISKRLHYFSLDLNLRS